MIEFDYVKGDNKAKIVLFALSTCGWCAKVKKFFNESGIAYSYVDVDLLPNDEKDPILKELEKWNSQTSFPTIVVNDRKVIVGYNTDQIWAAIKNE